MCNHEWKILVSYAHPYMMSKKIIYKKCVFCGEEAIKYKLNPSGIFIFAKGLINHKSYQKTLVNKK